MNVVGFGVVTQGQVAEREEQGAKNRNPIDKRRPEEELSLMEIMYDWLDRIKDNQLMAKPLKPRSSWKREAGENGQQYQRWQRGQGEWEHSRLFDLAGSRLSVILVRAISVKWMEQKPNCRGSCGGERGKTRQWVYAQKGKGRREIGGQLERHWGQTVLNPFPIYCCIMIPCFISIIKLFYTIKMWF